ncbi:MAG: glutaredoxin family protein [Burkholderiales bacterium]
MKAPRADGLPTLTLYSREYCHLCHEMLAALQCLPGVGFGIEVVDVDSDPDLERRYGEWVPLLMHGDTELCRYRLDAERVRAYLAELR